MLTSNASHDYYQSDEKISISIYRKGLNKEDVSVKFETRVVSDGMIIPCLSGVQLSGCEFLAESLSFVVRVQTAVRS
jgi:hypothetical protein